MFINRDNYETIFLMYVDNELSAADRIMVEEFLSANEDLREEMEMLQSAVLPDEDMTFVPKTSLYKNATPVESVQESLLLLLDNELPGASKESLIKQISENPQIKEEWNLLQNTVLDKEDKVVFADKKSLYRRTERVIPMNFWRAVAAVLIGLGIFTGLTIYNDTKVNDSMAVEVKPISPTAIGPAANPVSKPVKAGEDLLTSTEKSRQPMEGDNKNPLPVAKDKIFVASNVVNRQPDVSKKGKENLDNQVVNLVKRDIEPAKEIISPRNNNKDVVIQESPVREELNTSLINDSDVGQARNTFARLAMNEEDPDRFLNMEEDKITRSKLGGFIRQVKRVVERNTKIKTSNGLRIGGFEIALK